MNAPLSIALGTGSYQERLARVMKGVPELRAIVAELYPGPVEMEIEEDPEIDGYRYLVFSVESKESVEEFLTRQLKWCDLKRELLGSDSDLAFLNVIATE